ncbi:MAG TPA: SDR family oxidoreductase [Thermoanaerobaculia bacterium]|nr:SDR family oxidoreductase [Thermoanaerobaculia bacterium]
MERKALVTGGAVRLGRAIALALGRAGCDVAVHHYRSAGAAEEVAAEIAALGRRAVALSADLMDEAACAPLVAEAGRRLGGLDVLVNSAAIFLPGDLATTSVEDWERQLALNLRAPFLLAQAFAAALEPDGRGAIVNVTDARARRPGRGHLAYRLSKHALEHLTALLALELAPRITVNAVAPGAMLAAGGDDEALARRVATAVPLRRAGGAEPVAEAVLYFLREDFATGVVLPVDGGEYL